MLAQPYLNRRRPSRQQWRAVPSRQPERQSAQATFLERCLGAHDGETVAYGFGNAATATSAMLSGQLLKPSETGRVHGALAESEEEDCYMYFERVSQASCSYHGCRQLSGNPDALPSKHWKSIRSFDKQTCIVVAFSMLKAQALMVGFNFCIGRKGRKESKAMKQTNMMKETNLNH